MKMIALFRGINVGGKNIVKMADLKKLLDDIGCRNVRSYIQSGNMVFETDADANALKSKMEEAFVQAFGFTSAVTLRTEAEWAAILAGLPFSPEEVEAVAMARPEVEHVYVYLAEEMMDPMAVAQLKSGYSGGDVLELGERELYLLCQDSIRDSKLAASLAKLSFPLTSRNWKTVRKLEEMISC